MEHDILDIFPVLILIARPAAGKSEIIHYLQTLDDDDRSSRFHIGKMYVIDDFPMIWTWFEEDDLLTQMGHPRLHTNDGGYFLHNYSWDLLIQRMSLEYIKYIHDLNKKNEHTVVFEFSRGKEHDGYKSAFANIPESILLKAAILYVNVSWEESLRKNRKRFNPEKPDSILEHSLPDEKLARLYRETDWNELSAQNSRLISIGQLSIPYTVFENEDDITSGNNSELCKRLEAVLASLWKTYKSTKAK
jgi:hypothetical protein